VYVENSLTQISKGGVEPMSAGDKSGYGLSLFRKGASKREKQFQVGWTLFFVFVFLLQVWPLYIIGNRTYPLVLGMPFSMFWVVLCIIINFAGLLVMYNSETKRR